MMRPGYRIIVHRDGALETRQWHVPRWVVRAVAILGIGAAGALLLLGLLYGPIVAAAARLPLMELENSRLRAENDGVLELARRLEEAESRYAHVRNMLGADIQLPQVREGGSVAREVGGEAGMYVAPPMLARAPRAAPATEEEGFSIPRRWPLAVSSYPTRGLAQGDPSVESHTGLDLAVPIGSEVRAAGGGMVRETGTDSALGDYVVLAHPEGYETVYGHLSRVLVSRGATVGPGQVIALSGNTGRSTAPHLHFEVRRHGRSVDPLTLVREDR